MVIVVLECTLDTRVRHSFPSSFLSLARPPSLSPLHPSPRASNMEEKHELFWKQGDFGYVKDVADSMMTLCKPQAKVSTHLQVVHNGRRVKVELMTLALLAGSSSAFDHFDIMRLKG